MSIPVLDSVQPDALWISVSPSFQRLDRRLLNDLSHQIAIAQWAYYQTPDEPSSLEVGLTLLHDYLKGHDRPLHLLGHGTSGLLALLYARRYPERVRSLTLLAVGPHAAVNWQSHYYTQLQQLPCSREAILTQTVYSLIGRHSRMQLRRWINRLEYDLTHAPSPHSLLHHANVDPAGVSVPLLVCGGRDDKVVAPPDLQAWQPFLKPGDRLWQCPGGRHFFHAFYPQQVGQEILAFWATARARVALQNWV